MEKVKALIVDDSTVIRMLLQDVLSKDPEVEVVGTAMNGQDALTKIAQLKPDVVTLDIEMPVMDGLTALKEIRKNYSQLPVIMSSTLTVRGGQATLEALASGASDYIAKPTQMNNRQEAFDYMNRELVPRVKIFGKSYRNKRNMSLQPATATAAREAIVANNLVTGKCPRVDVIAIGCSTGGPNALTEIIPLISKNIPVPIVIVQHMPQHFTKLLADSLSGKSQIKVIESQGDEELKPGFAYIAPGDFHMVVENKGGLIKTKLNQGPPENSCRPAVDVLFRSIANIYGKHVLSIILTGMGQDGMLGVKEIQDKGGYVLAQDEKSCVVWGMPGAVVKAGLANKILDIKLFANEIHQAVKIDRLNIKL